MLDLKILGVGEVLGENQIGTRLLRQVVCHHLYRLQAEQVHGPQQPFHHVVTAGCLNGQCCSSRKEAGI
jgi:hypothetical protein